MKFDNWGINQNASRHVEANGSPRNTESISRWNKAGAPVNPNSMQQNW